ncbi:hypothetical protein ACIBP6_07370 [Nonomuraea terrae]|uniref:hypothetical protein n=1 Tax=Nonomuraea terrae TaxID=2530383 RepID=UPI0037B11A7C
MGVQAGGISGVERDAVGEAGGEVGFGFAAVPLMLLPYSSSAFVPADKVGPGVRECAEHQPFTSIIENPRGLPTGAPSAGPAITAIPWCAGLTLIGYLWARTTFTKRG